MKKIVTIFFAGLAVSLMISYTAMAEEITIVGTGSGTTILKAVGQSFSNTNPGVTVNVPQSIGSGGGIKAVGTDNALIGRVARQIKSSEKHYGLTYLPFVKIPIVIFVNKTTGVKDLSSQQVCGIFEGRITNWKEVGGTDGRIRVVRREDGDSSLKVLLASFPGFKDITITPKSKTTLTDQSTIRSVKEKAGTIAFGAYPNAKVSDVTVLSIDGIRASESCYPYLCTVALIFKSANLVNNISKFVEFATSPDAHSAIKNTGGLPM